MKSLLATCFIVLPVMAYADFSQSLGRLNTIVSEAAVDGSTEIMFRGEVVSVTGSFKDRRLKMRPEIRNANALNSDLGECYVRISAADMSYSKKPAVYVDAMATKESVPTQLLWNNNESSESRAQFEFPHNYLASDVMAETFCENAGGGTISGALVDRVCSLDVSNPNSINFTATEKQMDQRIFTRVATGESETVKIQGLSADAIASVEIVKVDTSAYYPQGWNSRVQVRCQNLKRIVK